MSDQPFRIQTDAGHRKYLCSGLYLPSVTTVLGATESEKAKRGLKQWIEKNPGASEEAAARGTAVHLACENYIRGLPTNIPDEYAAFFQGMDKVLDFFDSFDWSETPLRSDWYHLRSDDKQTSYVWSTEHQYAGCPDVVGRIGGVKVIADFKTSVAPYRTSFPDRGDAQGYGGFREYQKCSQQLGAYRNALLERTGFRCEAALIIVATEETTQAIFVDDDQLSLAESRFLKRCEQFHSLYPD